MPESPPGRVSSEWYALFIVRFEEGERSELIDEIVKGFLAVRDLVRFKVREGADVVEKLGTILEIHPARVFRERGIRLPDAGKHCKIRSEGSDYYKRINKVKKATNQAAANKEGTKV